MSHRVHVQRQVSGGPHRRTITTAADMALRVARSGPSELTVVLTDSRRMRRLNARFAAEDRVTDVLAFPAGASGRGHHPRYLGDIVIALPRARAQARRRGVPLTHEIALLAIHGTLHLLGHDHGRPADRRRMWARQSAALRRLGLDPDRLQDPP